VRAGGSHCLFPTEELSMARGVYVFQELDDAECRRRLGTVPIGRLGFTEAALPRIVPVHFTVRGDEVVISSLAGSKVSSAERGDVVAFEVDSWDAGTGEGWCVGVVGASRLVTDEAEIAELDALAFAPWRPEQGRRYFGVALSLVSGRAVVREPDRASVSPATRAPAEARRRHRGTADGGQPDPAEAHRSSPDCRVSAPQRDAAQPSSANSATTTRTASTTASSCGDEAIVDRSDLSVHLHFEAFDC
jgi:hypothetical protein